MENIIDYTKNELHTFNEKEFNAVDSLILSQASYIILDELVGDINSNSKSLKFKDLLIAELFPKMFDTIPYGKFTNELLFHLAASPRFRDIQINYHISKIDENSEKQFSATTFILDNTTAYIAFRGTDYSVVGWKEDFNLSCINVVPSHTEGVKYINSIAKLIPHNFYVGGHSKGGNIAIYASMHCDYNISSRIKRIFSHDSPGFRKEIIESNYFTKIENKIEKTLPSSSLIGLLLENNDNYHVVKSDKVGGLRQHNPFSWEIKDFNFNYVKKISNTAKCTNITLNKCLNELNDEKRKQFINSIFDIFNATKSDNFIEISKNWRKNIPVFFDSIKHMDSETKSMFIELIKEFSGLYIKNLTHNHKNTNKF